MFARHGTQSIDLSDVGVIRCNTQGELYSVHAIETITSGVNDQVSSSTEEELRSSFACHRVDMMASWNNTGYIYVGGTGVSAANGIRLAPGDFYSVDCVNTNDILVLASVNNEDIHYTIFS